MTIVKCDRCGAVSTAYVLSLDINKHLPSHAYMNTIKFPVLDICDNCFEALKLWLNLEDVNG